MSEQNKEDWVPPWIYAELRKEVAELRALYFASIDRLSKVEQYAVDIEKLVVTEKNDRTGSVGGIGFRVGELETKLGELREKTAEDRGANDAKARQMATRAQAFGGSAIVLWIVELAQKLFGGMR